MEVAFSYKCKGVERGGRGGGVEWLVSHEIAEILLELRVVSCGVVSGM